MRSIEYLEDLLRITTRFRQPLCRVTPTNIRNLNDEGGISLRHADYIIQVCVPDGARYGNAFYGQRTLVVLRFFSYLYEFGVCSKLWLYNVAFLNRQNLIAA